MGMHKDQVVSDHVYRLCVHMWRKSMDTPYYRLGCRRMMGAMKGMSLRGIHEMAREYHKEIHRGQGLSGRRHLR